MEPCIVQNKETDENSKKKNSDQNSLNYFYKELYQKKKITKNTVPKEPIEPKH